jgi:NADPH-ferrihemoprotein reductase
VLDAGREVWEVFEAFPSLRPPLGAFLELCPKLQARLYTISSSAAVHPDRIHVTVSVLAQRARSDPSRVHRGVASTHLAACAVPARGAAGGAWPSVRVYVRRSSFALPADPRTPIVMVGPGTGIAPMRAFLQERDAQRAARGAAGVGETVLFFGCRKQREDFIYEDELLEYTRRGSLTWLFTAFSRDGEALGAERVYVQKRMAEQAALLYRLLRLQRGHLYVCGGTAMGRDVQHALEAAFAEQLLLDSAAGVVRGTEAALGKLAVKEMQADSRYIQELWS